MKRLLLAFILLGSMLNGSHAQGTPDILISEQFPIGVRDADGGVNGGWGGSGYEGGSQGAFWDGGSGWYAKKSVDGSGYEFGMLHGHDLNYDGPVRIKWTPIAEGGGIWSILEGPPGATLVSYNPENYNETGWVTYDPNIHNGNFTISDVQNGYDNREIFFDSDNFVAGPPSPEELAWWNNRFEQFYLDNPNLPNRYNPNSPNDSNGSGDVIINQAQELNIGLEFSNGQWVPAQ